MEVVLLENIKNLGVIGDVVNVKRGHGRNFLIKYGKALKASKMNIDLVKKKGVKISNIKLVSLLASPEGLKNLRKKQRGLHIFTCSVDKKLNKNKFIVPGLGDAGDRYMGT